MERTTERGIRALRALSGLSFVCFPFSFIQRRWSLA